MSDRGWLTSKVGLLFCLIVVCSLVPSAKADTLTFTGATSNITLNISDSDANPAYSNLNAVIGPYTGILNSNSTLLWCVDPDHHVSNGNTWTVYVSQFANVSQTYLKNANIYGEMAWLISQFPKATTVIQKQALQAAIWSLAEVGSSGFTINVPVGNTLFWNAYNQDMKNASSNMLTSGFEILTDLNGTKQEFIVMTPEPSTFFLLGIGLVALMLFAHRKKARIASSVVSGV